MFDTTLANAPSKEILSIIIRMALSTIHNRRFDEEISGMITWFSRTAGLESPDKAIKPASTGTARASYGAGFAHWINFPERMVTDHFRRATAPLPWLEPMVGAPPHVIVAAVAYALGLRDGEQTFEMFKPRDPIRDKSADEIAKQFHSQTYEAEEKSA